MNTPLPRLSDNGVAPWFRAASAVTGVGSVPHVDVASAVEFVARVAPKVPFWPQLRRLSPREAMIPQTFGPSVRHLTSVRGEYEYALAPDRVERFAVSLEREAGQLDPATAAGFGPFVEAVGAGAFPAVRAVKGQVMGPVTLACSLTVCGTSMLERGDLREMMGDHVVRIARWQTDALRRLAPTVIMVLDEAYLGVAIRRDPAGAGAIADLLRSVVLRIRKPGVFVGIHCCDEIPFSVLESIAPDLYFFDAHHGAGALAEDACAHRFLTSGGQIAWGWIPTQDDLSHVDPQAIVDRWWNVTEKLSARGGGMTAERMASSSLVTASCGLAGSSVVTCERSFALAAEVARRFVQRCAPT